MGAGTFYSKLYLGEGGGGGGFPARGTFVHAGDIEKSKVFKSCKIEKGRKTFISVIKMAFQNI